MFTNIKPLDRHGRIRFGSDIFVDIKNETIIDTIIGEHRLHFIQYIGLLLIFMKIISADIVGIVVTLVLYYSIYFLSEHQISQTFTKKRVLSISKYKYPSLLRTVSLILFLTNLMPILFLFNSDLIIFHRLDIMGRIYNWLHILPIVSLRLLQFQNSIKNQIRLFEMVLTISMNAWVSLYFMNLKYRFTEVNLSQISDQLISITRRTTLQRLLSLHSFDVLLLLILNKLSLIYLITVLILHTQIPRSEIYEIKFFGHSGRKLLPSLMVEKYQLYKIKRITASLFFGDAYSRSEQFPKNIIPNEVASYYETGPAASLIYSLKLGNKIGGVLALSINLFVIIELFKFAFNYNIDTLPVVIGISIGLVVGMLLLGFTLNYLGKIQYKFQKKESLMIGHGFIGRWIDPNLWIIKGDKLEGRRNKGKQLQNFFSYERATGFKIAWRAIIPAFTISIFIFFIIFWIAVGALNVSKLVFILPFVFDLGLNFLTVRLNAALGFYMTASFILWLIIYYFFPKIHARYLPRMIFDLEHLSTISVILKDEADLTDASSQFVKCIVSSSRPMRRKTTGRPGSFMVVVSLVGYYTNTGDRSIFFTIGEHLRKSAIIRIKNNISFTENLIIMEDLRISAERGYPRFPISIYERLNEEEIILHNELIELDQLYDQFITLKTENNLTFTLKFDVIRIEA